MIEHLVLFRVKAHTQVEDELKMLNGLRSLPGHVASIVELSCGKNTSDRSQGFTHGLLVRFRSQADLDAYIVHPEHRRIVSECISPIVENVIVVDYEV